MANKRGSVNWYQPEFHMLEKSQTKRSFYCFPIKKDIIRQFRPFLQLHGERKESRAIKELVQVTIFEWLSKTPNVNVIFLYVWNDHHRINLARVLQIRSTYFPDLFSISCIPRTFRVVHAILKRFPYPAISHQLNLLVVHLLPLSIIHSNQKTGDTRTKC